MRATKVYIFAGEFDSIKNACVYSQKQWEPEPHDSVSDEEYEKWEKHNPTHSLKKNISSYLDEDFIETIHLDYDYLKGIELSESDLNEVKNKTKGDNVFVLVFEDALGEFELNSEPKSTPELNYCGVYSCVL